jgi:hypothetical protein
MIYHVTITDYYGTVVDVDAVDEDDAINQVRLEDEEGAYSDDLRDGFLGCTYGILDDRDDDS